MDDTDKRPHREIQLEELDTIMAIYGDAVTSKHEKCSPHVSAKDWKPMSVEIATKPYLDGNDKTVYVGATLCIKCSKKYPSQVPQISLANVKGLSQTQQEELLQLLISTAEEARNKPIIFVLVSKAADFLTDYNTPPRNALLEKAEEERKQSELLAALKKRQTDEERQHKLHEIERQKEEYDLQNSYVDGQDQEVFPVGCASPHRRSQKLTFPSERAITRSVCVGHLRNGGVAYVGIEMSSGKPLWLVEWNIKNSQLKAKCNTANGKCLWKRSNVVCAGNHNTDDIIKSIQEEVAKLSSLTHRNIIQYKDVKLTNRKYGLQIYMIYEYVRGLTVSELTKMSRLSMEDARQIASGVLEALSYLHNYLHARLFYQLFARLSARQSRHDKYHDRSTRPPMQGDSNILVPMKTVPKQVASVEMEDERQTMRMLTRFSSMHQITNPAQSRLLSDFEVLRSLGTGAFGNVLEARNRTDSRTHAIKCIVLKKATEQLSAKMMREVSLLSRLCHENVVRYFNSWIDCVNTNDMKAMSHLLLDDASLSYSETSDASSVVVDKIIKKAETSSMNMIKNLKRCNVSAEDDDSDFGVEFVYSDGEEPSKSWRSGDMDSDDSDGESGDDDDETVDDDEDESETSTLDTPRKNNDKLVYVMYIQMEYCEKFTLRTAIDNGLHEKPEKMWRLFREIVEGIAYIHKQGIIHRDLKPVNIFLDKFDQIKIGDFGLATTSFLQAQTSGLSSKNLKATSTTGSENGTGCVGTELYVAPELYGKASSSQYNQSVDIYTLGIILFEMCNPPFTTLSERAETIIKLRQKEIIIPESMLTPPGNSTEWRKDNAVELLRLLLNHNSYARPSAEELLASPLLPSVQIDDEQLSELLRNALAKPKSKPYRELVSRCLAQKSDDLLQDTYYFNNGQTFNVRDMLCTIDEEITTLDPVVESVEERIVRTFRKHGAIKVNLPLLTPLTENTRHMNLAVRLMTQYGSVVLLPSNPRAQIAQLVAKRGITNLCCYSTAPIYREQKAFNCHPREQNICTFDMIAQRSSGPLEDAELLSVAYDIITELQDKKVDIHVCHMNILRAMLVHCGVPAQKYVEVMNCITDYIQGRIKKPKCEHYILGITKQRSLDRLLEQVTLRSSITKTSNVSQLLPRHFNFSGESKKLLSAAVNALETLIDVAYTLGVKTAIVVDIGLGVQQRRLDVGFVWQISTNLKLNGAKTSSTVLAIGERYDGLLQQFQDQNIKQIKCGNSGVGATFFLDKLIALAADECREGIDIGICLARNADILPTTKTMFKIIRSMGLRYRFWETDDRFDSIVKLLQKLGASIVLTIFEDNSIKADFTQEEKFNYVDVNNIEETLRKHFSTAPYGLAVNVSKTVTKSNLEVIYMSGQLKRREMQMLKYLEPKLTQFRDDQPVKVLVTDLSINIINALAGAITPWDLSRNDYQSIDATRNESRAISEIHEKIVELHQHNQKPVIVLMRCTQAASNYHRVIL